MNILFRSTRTSLFSNVVYPKCSVWCSVKEQHTLDLIGRFVLISFVEHCSPEGHK